MDKKRKKEQHWEMLRWIVLFLEENKVKWDELRKRRLKDEQEQVQYEEWRKSEIEEKGRILESRKKRTETTREERIQIALQKKQAWIKWRGEDQQKDENWKRKLQMKEN